MRVLGTCVRVKKAVILQRLMTLLFYFYYYISIHRVVRLTKSIYYEKNFLFISHSAGSADGFHSGAGRQLLHSLS